MRLTYRVALTGLPLAAASPAGAQTIDLTVTIPRMTVAEYHAPYVAIWLERAGASAKTLSVWYDFDNRENGGKKWLTDVRTWWRASGRALSLPANGVSGATRPPGTHKVSYSPAQLGALTPGQYTLVIEAAREVGGREVVRLPFAWPARPGSRITATGKSELGALALSIR
ncbi:MAG: DUF2271 domain-containing protein [Pseudomonadota bacterium]